VQRAVLAASACASWRAMPNGEGAIEIDSIEPIGFRTLVQSWHANRDCLGVLDLLKVAKHGRSEKIYLVRFPYVRSRGKRVASRHPASV